MNPPDLLHETARSGSTASVVRQVPVGIPTNTPTGTGDEGESGAQATTLRLAQVQRVGRKFLRVRPLVVVPIALVNATALSTAQAPLAQRVSMVLSIALMTSLFVLEAWAVSRRRVTSRWLAISLGGTVVGLSLGCGLSGALASPLLPLVTAPLAVCFAAFGRSRSTKVVLAIAAVSMVALASIPEGIPFPPIAPASARVMLFAAMVGAAALSYAGVAGLVEAHARAAELLDRMRLATLEESASRMRATEQMGAKVAHELKNPLAAVRALLQLLEKHEVDDRARKRAAVAIAEIDRMDTIVRDYLAFSRPLSALEVTTVELSALCDEVVSVLEARALARGVRLTAQGTRLSMNVDPRRIREAVLNLAANAVDATPRGGQVRLTVARTESGASIRVEDEGKGMSPEVLARLGTPYFTTDEAGKGTGLGVVLARAAARQHGGTLDFTSVPGQGTVAMLELPDSPDTPELPRPSHPVHGVQSGEER